MPKLLHTIKQVVSPNQWRITLGMTRYFLRAILRNKSSIFFGLIFPLAMVGIFGSFGSGSAPVRLAVDTNVSAEQPLLKALTGMSQKDSAPVTIERGVESDLVDKLERGKLDGVLVPGSNPTTLELVTSNTNPSGRAAAEGLLNGVVSGLNLEAAQAPRVFGFTSRELSGQSLRMIDYILPGQIGFSLLAISTFGVAFPLLALRRTLVLKRLFATSMNPLSFVISQALARSVQGLLQAAVIIGVGVVAFDYTLSHGWVTVVNMLIISFLGVLTFLGFGVFIANIGRDEQSMPVLLNLFNLPQFLLSGAFFSTELLPDGLQKIGNNLPLAYLGNAMRRVALEGASLTDVWPYLLGLLAWAVVIYIAAAKTFKVE